MSVNPDRHTFHLRSIVRGGKTRGKGSRLNLKRGGRVADVTINVGPSDAEKPKQTEVEEVPTVVIEQNQFLPGAVSINSFILMFFLFYLEKKDHVQFSSSLVVTYPLFIGCEDNKHCVLESKIMEIHHTNVTHLFIFVLMFIGYLPVHILYLTKGNREHYERGKNVICIVLFSVLFAIIQGQHNILYQITVALNNFIILSVGVLIQHTSSYTIHYIKWCFFVMVFLAMFVQTLPTITAYWNQQNLPGFSYVVCLLWFCEYFIEILLRYKPNLSYLHLIVQIIMCWCFSFVFWEYARIED